MRNDTMVEPIKVYELVKVPCSWLDSPLAGIMSSPRGMFLYKLFAFSLIENNFQYKTKY